MRTSNPAIDSELPSHSARKLELASRSRAGDENERDGQLTARARPAGINDKTEARPGLKEAG